MRLHVFCWGLWLLSFSGVEAGQHPVKATQHPDEVLSKSQGMGCPTLSPTPNNQPTSSAIHIETGTKVASGTSVITFKEDTNLTAKAFKEYLAAPDTIPSVMASVVSVSAAPSTQTALAANPGSPTG